jgi:hypothetical protein
MQKEELSEELKPRQMIVKVGSRIQYTKIENSDKPDYSHS